MKIIKKLLTKIAHVNLWWAASAGFSAFVASLLLDVNFEIKMFFILFLITFSIYSFNGYTDQKEDAINTPERGEFIGKFSDLMLFFSIIAYCLTLWLSLFGSEMTTIVVLISGMIGVLYSVKLVPIKLNKKKEMCRLKEIPVIKNMSIGSAWALSAVFIPLSFVSKGISITAAIIVIFFFFRTFINTTTFDMRDIKGDKKNGIKTIPVILGFYKTKWILIIMNSLLGLFILLSTTFGLLPSLAHIMNVSTVYTFGYLYFIERIDDLKFFCAIVVDGEYLFIGLLVLFWITLII